MYYITLYPNMCITYSTYFCAIYIYIYIYIYWKDRVRPDLQLHLSIVNPVASAPGDLLLLSQNLPAQARPTLLTTHWGWGGGKKKCIKQKSSYDHQNEN